MLNKIILIGNLGRDPEIQTTQDGRQIAKFSLATSSSWRARPRENTEIYSATDNAAANGSDIVTHHASFSSSLSLSSSQDQVEWHRIVVFRDTTVRWIKDVLKQGDTVYVEGRLTYYKYQDPQGRSHRISNIAVSGQHGRVEHLRSKKPLNLSSIAQKISENLEFDHSLEKTSAENPDESSAEDFNYHPPYFQHQGEPFDE